MKIRKCTTYAIAITCDDESDHAIKELWELANTLADMVGHTTFEAFVDDKYADPIGLEPLEVDGT